MDRMGRLSSLAPSSVRRCASCASATHLLLVRTFGPFTLRAGRIGCQCYQLTILRWTEKEGVLSARVSRIDTVSVPSRADWISGMSEASKEDSGILPLE